MRDLPGEQPVEGIVQYFSPARSSTNDRRGHGHERARAASLRRPPGRRRREAVPRPGGLTNLPPGADLAAYRVVQEGLTNVLRHAGQATASVAVRWDERLEITVSDNGSGAGPTDLSVPHDMRAGADPGKCAGTSGAGASGAGTSGPGRGLLGLRERLALYGGELTAGPRPGGGWRVQATLPLTGLPAPDLAVARLTG